MHTLHYMKVMLEIPQRPAPTLEGGNWSPAFRAFVARCLRKSPRAVRPHAQRQYGSGWSYHSYLSLSVCKHAPLLSLYVCNSFLSIYVGHPPSPPFSVFLKCVSSLSLPLCCGTCVRQRATAAELLNDVWLQTEDPPDVLRPLLDKMEAARTARLSHGRPVAFAPYAPSSHPHAHVHVPFK
jgi:hypothetical protein